MERTNDIGINRFAFELADRFASKVGFPSFLRTERIAGYFFDAAFEVITANMRDPNDGNPVRGEYAMSAVYSLWMGFLENDVGDVQEKAWRTGKEARCLYEQWSTEDDEIWEAA